MERFADWFSEHRKPLAVAVVVVTAVAGFGFSRLRFDDRPRGIFKSNDEAHALLEEVFADFGSDDNDCILVVEADDLFAPKPIAALRELVAEARRIDGVQHVRSMDDAVLFEPAKLPRSLLPARDASAQAFARARSDALDHPLIGGQILSEDGQMTLVIVRLAGDSLGVNEIRPIVTQLRQINARINDSGAVHARLTGIPPARVEIYEMLQREQIKFGLSGALLGILVAYLLFRRAAAVLIVVAAPLTGTLWTLGALGLVGEKLNVINSVLPTLVLVIGFTDAVHLMYDLRRSRRNRLTPQDAARSAIRHLVLACALTSITTAIGFGSLGVGRLEIIRHFGLACAAGTVLSFLAVITIVPLLAGTRLGRRIHVPHGRRSPARHIVLLDAIATSVTRRAAWFAVIGTILTLTLGVSVLRLKPDNSLKEAMPTSN
ncbi:MAG: MMPL family transporter, partial [Planctomycetes bacterium]|nr:MMPL family transporter [Planctomycetota bacterium]